MIRKIFKTGNSMVVSLPKEVIDYLQVGEGTEVSVSLDRGKRRIVITPVDPPLTIAGVDPEFARQVSEFIDQYRPALQELAR